MRIWDVEPKFLCRKHLLAEHRELHGLWNILTLNKKGYSRHPETLRWVGKLPALFARHEKLVKEMERRGWKHKTKLDYRLAKGKKSQKVLLMRKNEQVRLLAAKDCDCFRKNLRQ